MMHDVREGATLMGRHVWTYSGRMMRSLILIPSRTSPNALVLTLLETTFQCPHRFPVAVPTMSALPALSYLCTVRYLNIISHFRLPR